MTARNVNVAAGGGDARASAGMSSGKWYWEMTRNATAVNQGVGIVSSGIDTKNGNPWGYVPQNSAYRLVYGQYFGFGSFRADVKDTQMSKGQGDILGFALDMDTGTISVYENCSASPYAIWSGLSGTWYPVVGSGGGVFDATSSVTANFGKTDFQCASPAGYNKGVW